jgi:hypothetical protein
MEEAIKEVFYSQIVLAPKLETILARMYQTLQDNKTMQLQLSLMDGQACLNLQKKNLREKKAKVNHSPMEQLPWSLQVHKRIMMVPKLSQKHKEEFWWKRHKGSMRFKLNQELSLVKMKEKMLPSRRSM